MPRRHDTEGVRQRFIAAGYIPDNDFTYRNNKQKHRVYDILNGKYVNVSLQTLDYNIKKGHRPLWEQPPTPTTEPAGTTRDNDSLSRFRRAHDNTFASLPVEVQQSTYNEYKCIRGLIMRQRDFTYVMPNDQLAGMRATIMALQDSLARVLQKHTIRLKLTTTEGRERYFHVNPTTLNDLWGIFKDVEPDFSVEDSSGNFMGGTFDIVTIAYTFKERSGQRMVAAGFFPYVNMSDTDLERYGIYTPQRIENAVEPCIITAFKHSGVLSAEQLAQLHEMINTREFPQQSLKHIAEHFNISIYVRKYHEDGKSSHVEFTPATATATVRLMIYHGHYMLYEAKPSTYGMIKQMIKQGTLRPYTNAEVEKVFSAMINAPANDYTYDAARLIIRTAPKPHPHARGTHGEHFFGYKPEDTNAALDELQEFVNSLPLRHRVDVRQYYKFSTLMQRIMYEFGCFDDVYELAGTTRDTIRKELVFPTRELHCAPHVTLEGPLYYLDFNGAYCSFMTHIPTGPKGNGPANTKISELIRLMYAARKQATPGLSRTIKFMMCSCYGTSIAKPKRIKHKWSDNIQGTINNQGNFVIATPNTDSGFVSIVQPYVEHYNHPHFARVILDGFNNAVKDLREHVNVLFQNIDAFVVNEADYKKLCAMGYVHPTELGKLKVEHVFTSMRFVSKMKWVGVNEDGTEFRHCM